MTKLVMMIALAVLIPAAAVFAQEPKPDDLQPKYVQDKGVFAEYLESERVTVLYPPRRVCTKADQPRPGARFVGGPCVENFRLSIPIDNSPAWDCEKAHGVGNCLLIQFPNPEKATITDDLLLEPRLDPYYVPKCKQDFRHYFVFQKFPVRDYLPEYWLYCDRPKPE